MAGDGNPHFVKRTQDLGYEYQADEFSVVFWDLLGEQGHPIRATISEIGPLLLSRLLECNVAPASVGAIQRQLLVLDNQGAAKFFGEPALEIHDFIRVDRDKRGAINILAADKLMQSPRLYAAFLLWLLSELFEVLPEVGDLPKPKLVFFFDEEHLLFDNAPKAPARFN